MTTPADQRRRDALTRGCPHCGAAPHTPCTRRTVRGRPVPTDPHPSR